MFTGPEVILTLKIAVLVPTPKAIVSTAVSAKTGLFRSVRAANDRSCNAIVPPHPSAYLATETLAVGPNRFLLSLTVYVYASNDSEWLSDAKSFT